MIAEAKHGYAIDKIRFDIPSIEFWLSQQSIRSNPLCALCKLIPSVLISLHFHFISCPFWSVHGNRLASLYLIEPINDHFVTVIKITMKLKIQLDQWNFDVNGQVQWCLEYFLFCLRGNWNARLVFFKTKFSEHSNYPC